MMRIFGSVNNELALWWVVKEKVRMPETGNKIVIKAYKLGTRWKKVEVVSVDENKIYQLKTLDV